MKVLLSALLFALLLPLRADMPSPLAGPIGAFRRALTERADWTMKRRIGTRGPTLVSSGTVDCVAGSAIVWRVTAPFASSVAMTTNAMVFTDEDGTRSKPLADLPHYSEIREKTDAFVAGDATAFDGLFALDGTVSSDGTWRLVLKPRISAMEHLFTEIAVTGASLPTNAVLKTADGGSCLIDFKARK